MTREYNTKPNSTSYKIGHKKHPKSFGEGSKHKPESIEKISQSLLGKKEEQSRRWKGNNAGYVAIHTWLKNKLGKPTKCENPKCKSKNPKRFEWASRTRKLIRDEKNYIQLCSSCHRIYDIRKLSLEELFYGK